jgi:hypothetical protein
MGPHEELVNLITTIVRKELSAFSTSLMHSTPEPVATEATPVVFNGNGAVRTRKVRRPDGKNPTYWKGGRPHIKVLMTSRRPNGITAEKMNEILHAKGIMPATLGVPELQRTLGGMTGDKKLLTRLGDGRYILTADRDQVDVPGI